MPMVLAASEGNRMAAMAVWRLTAYHSNCVWASLPATWMRAHSRRCSGRTMSSELALGSNEESMKRALERVQWEQRHCDRESMAAFLAPPPESSLRRYPSPRIVGAGCWMLSGNDEPNQVNTPSLIGLRPCSVTDGGGAGAALLVVLVSALRVCATERVFAG